MDPDANREQQRMVAEEIIALRDEVIPEPDDSMDSWYRYDELSADRSEILAGLAIELAELVVELSDWTQHGGFS